MAQSEIEDLGIKYREEVELEDIVITHTHVNRNDIYKLFASKIKKRMGGHPSRKNKPLDNKKGKLGGDALWNCFTYRGIRVRTFYRHIRGITWFIWWFPSLLAIGNYWYLNLEELKDHPLPQVYYIGVFLLLLVWSLTYLIACATRKLSSSKSSIAYGFCLAS